MHEVLLERQARRELDRLPADMFQRIIEHIKDLARTPRPTGCRKLSGSRSDYRIRVGDYRVVYEIDDEARQVRVLRIRHRREAYR